METWSIKEMPIWGTALWKSLWKSEVCINVGHINARQNNPLPGSEGNWNQHADIPVHSLMVSTWLHEMSEYRGTCSNAEMG